MHLVKLCFILYQRAHRVGDQDRTFVPDSFSFGGNVESVDQS